MSTVKDYLQVITSQHSTKTKYIDLVTAYLDKLQDTEIVLNSFNEKFIMQLATGKQLDIIGNILNVSRHLKFSSTVGTGVLDDEDYYLALYSNIVKNNWDGSIQQLKEIWLRMFPETPIIVKDLQDMTADIYLMSTLSPLQLELLYNNMIIPKPFGVKVNFYEVDKPMFAYDVEYVTGNAYAGYDTGYYIEAL